MQGIEVLITVFLILAIIVVAMEPRAYLIVGGVTVIVVMFMVTLSPNTDMFFPKNNTMAYDPRFERDLEVIERAWEDKKFSEGEFDTFMGIPSRVHMETTDKEMQDILIKLEQDPESKTGHERYEALLEEIRSFRGGYALVLHAWDDEKFDKKEWDAIKVVDDHLDEDVIDMAETLEANPKSAIARNLFISTVEDARRHYEK